MASLLCVLFAAIVILAAKAFWLRRKLRNLEYAFDNERAGAMLSQNALIERVERLETEMSRVLNKTGLPSLEHEEEDRKSEAAWAQLRGDNNV